MLGYHLLLPQFTKRGHELDANLRAKIIYTAFTFGLFSRSVTGWLKGPDNQRLKNLVNTFDRFGITRELYDAYQDGQAKACEMYDKKCRLST